LPSGQDAVVCLQKGTEDYAVQTVTGTGGVVNANFVFTPNTTGTLSVTVTSHNFIPYEGYVTVTQTSLAHLYIESYIINDGLSGQSYGNGDGIIDAGEIIELPVTLRNGGSTSLSNVSATIEAYLVGTSMLHPYVDIAINWENFGNIAAGASATCGEDHFVLMINNNCPDKDKETIECRMTITADGGYSERETFYLQLGKPDVQHAHNTISSTLQANATVGISIQLSNYGTSIAKGIWAILTSSSSYITSITANPQTFGDISHNGSSERSYNFTISSNYPSGHEEYLAFTLTYQDTYGKIWTHNFDLKKPSVPASLQFTGHETAIDVNWGVNSDPDQKGYNVYRSTTPTGSYEKVNSRLIEGTSYFNDIDLQRETMYYYKVTAVDQSSNESNLSNYLEAWTTIRYVDGWPILAKGHLYSSPKLFDIDGNPTTISGLADLPEGNFWSTPAISDLDGNGINELVIAGRELNNTLYCWHINYGSVPPDGQPDLFWSKNLGSQSLGSPVVGDINGEGSQEVIVMPENGNIYIFNFDGSDYQTNPWKTTDGYAAYSTPALADLDSDGKLEIIGSGGDGIIHVWKYIGTEMWSFNTGRNELSASPVVADIDGDGQYEIIAAAYNNPPSNCIIYVKDRNGNDKPGWIGGKSISNPAGVVSSSPAIGNLDSDNQLEIYLQPALQFMHGIMTEQICLDGPKPVSWEQSLHQ